MYVYVCVCVCVWCLVYLGLCFCLFMLLCVHVCVEKGNPGVVVGATRELRPLWTNVLPSVSRLSLLYFTLL